jgi:hypothetical protein
MTLADRHRHNLATARKAAGYSSPEQLAAAAWPDIDARTTGGQRVRAIESGRSKLSSPFADELAVALGLDVSFFGAAP